MFYCTDGETEARGKSPAGTIVRTRGWTLCLVARHESTLGRLCPTMQDNQTISMDRLVWVQRVT